MATWTELTTNQTGWSDSTTPPNISGGPFNYAGIAFNHANRTFNYFTFITNDNFWPSVSNPQTGWADQ